MKFVHAADPHIDSPMKGLSAYPGAPVEAMRGATRQAFESLVDLCVAERADLLLLAGDVRRRLEGFQHRSVSAFTARASA